MTDRSLFAFGFTHHRKVRRLSDAAFRLWVTAIDHANQDRSGGVVTDDDLDCYPRSPRDEARDIAVGELVTLNLWDPLSPGRWSIHDFDEWQASREPADTPAEHQPKESQLDQPSPADQWPRPSQLGGIARAAASRTPAGTFSAGPAVTSREPAGEVACFPPDPLSDQNNGISGGSETSGSGDSDQPKKKGSARRRTQLPGHWEPTVEHVERARELGLDLKSEVERFRTHATATERLMANWNATFTMWLQNATRFAPRGQARRTTAPQPSHGRTGFEDT